MKQGDSLSELHSIINKTYQKGTVFMKSTQIFGYSDDIAIVSTNVSMLREIYKGMEAEPAKFELTVNESKTKYMVISNHEDRRVPYDLEINEKCFKGMVVLTI